ncbi:phosphatidate cytidylyltransferase [Tardiphaga sp. 37S4]|uniref:phosphatidate cytidylyltransferase n=1 Tax=Tardiphaga sp. 37S4 TaxID=1404741 RepID=UPI001E3A2B82|nr:phosphatidate cytidylyltransferase [Tardiphaga sp. 37S4]UFS78736.1 phosphatidate cytidylyltransferase [Tardiphaga sp. 37S4]
MTQNDSTPKQADDRGLRNLLMRVLAALVLIPVAILAAYTGGWLWFGLVTLVSVGLFLEWRAIVGNHVGWIGLGVVYALAAFAASIVVRLDPVWGFSALMFILLVVWMTDIGGYFAGRGIGGPKLWPRVSPKKTWAGAIGGFVLSLAVAAGFAMDGFGSLLPLLMIATVLTVLSQLGDLFESAVKRKFGVKNSGQIIPGHGGLLDRLDGYVFAVVAAAVIGLLRGGADGVGRGLMVW